MHVLLVEDDLTLAQYIEKGLRAENIEVSAMDNVQTAGRMLDSFAFDAIVVDLSSEAVALPATDFCRKVKFNWPQTPLMVLSQHGEMDDKESAFAAGADDFVAKPFAFRELLLRLRALVRRAQAQLMPGTGKYTVADLELDTYLRQVRRQGREINLTPREFALLEYLARNQHRAVTRAEILEQVWHLHFDTTTNIVDVYINYLRRKIDKEYRPKLIKTVIGTGYRLAASEVA